jgi:hypothetical protein
MRCCPHVNRLLGLLLGIAFISGLVIMNSQRPSAAEEKPELLRHVVMFQFKESSSEKEVQHVVDEFMNLRTKIEAIADLEYGINNSPEKHDNGFTHCFLVTFKSEEDRAIYLPHPAHQEFVKVLLPHLEKVQVIDYWAKK